jgi:hypothetical protein
MLTIQTCNCQNVAERIPSSTSENLWRWTCCEKQASLLEIWIHGFWEAEILLYQCAHGTYLFLCLQCIQIIREEFSKFISSDKNFNGYHFIAETSPLSTECVRPTILLSEHDYQYSETNVMHFLFNLLGIEGLYMFRALLAHPQEVLNKHTKCRLCSTPPEDEQVMLETCREPQFLINWIKSASCWFHYTDILWRKVNKTLTTWLLSLGYCISIPSPSSLTSGVIYSKSSSGRWWHFTVADQSDPQAKGNVTKGRPTSRWEYNTKNQS